MSYHHFVKSLLRHRSRISREWKRHLKEGSYSPRNAQESYHMAKSHCGRKRMLERDHNLRRKKAVHSILLNKLFKNSCYSHYIHIFQ